MRDGICNECARNKPIKARGFCAACYTRLTRNGTLQRTRPALHGVPDDVRFDTGYVVDAELGCWVWQRSFAGGYGKFHTVDRPNCSTHKFAWERKNGSVPDGLYLDHFLYPGRCVGPFCCSPDHVRPVTPLENVLRGDTFAARNRAAEECIHGHAFTLENTYIYPTPLGGVGRGCRKCRTATSQRHAQRRRASR